MVARVSCLERDDVPPRLQRLVIRRRMSVSGWCVRVLVGLLVFHAWCLPAALAQPARAGVVTALEGRATVARPVLAAPAALKFKDEVFVRDRIDTREASIVRVLLGGTALVTVRELSTFTVTEGAGRAVVELQSGRLALTVAKARLRPGESIEVRTPNAIAAVRGSLIVAEVGIVAGVPETTFSALRVTVPILVASRTDPAAVISLGVNQAVGIVGPGVTARLTPVVALPPARVRELARAAEAPKPKEHTDKAPEESQKRVAEKKAEEAAELATVLGREASAAFAAMTPIQRAGFEATVETVTEAVENLTKSVTEFVEEFKSLAAAEVLFNPQFEIVGALIRLDADVPLLIVSGRVRSEVAPIVLISESEISQSGRGNLIRFEPGTSASLAGNLLFATNSKLSTGGQALFLGEGASVSVGGGTFGFLELLFSEVTTGAEFIRLEPRAQLTLERPLLSASESPIVAGVDPASPRPFIAVGAGAQLKAPKLASLVSFFGASLTTGGSLLFLDDNALVADQGSLLLPLFEMANNTVTTGRSFVELRPGARLDLNRPLIRTTFTTFLAGTDPGSPQPFISIGPGAQVIETQNSVPLVSLTGTVTTGGSLLFLGENAALTSERVANFGAFLISGSQITTGPAVFELGRGAQLNLRGDQPLLSAFDDAFVSSGSFLLLGEGATLTTEGRSIIWLLQFDRALSQTSVTTGAGLVDLRPGAQLRLSLNRPLVSAVDTTFTLGGSLLLVDAGGVLQSEGSGFPLIELRSNVLESRLTTSADLIALKGSATALDAETGLTLGTDRPLQYSGTILQTSGATVTGQRVLQIDTALLEASAPLLDLKSGSSMTTSLDAVELSLKAKVAGLGPLVRLDGSTLTVSSGALFNVAGGSVVSVTGDLLSLANGSALNLLNGPVLSVSGGSVVTITGALAAFTGSGGNTLSVANSLCPCTTLSGIPVALVNGASVANVSIGATAIKNPGLGVVKLSSANAALITVSGAASKVTIGAP